MNSIFADSSLPGTLCCGADFRERSCLPGLNGDAGIGGFETAELAMQYGTLLAAAYFTCYLFSVFLSLIKIIP